MSPRGLANPGRSRVGERGQVLPLVALFMVVLFGMAALAIDVSRAYSEMRLYRAASDAASLAGAQDLQQTGGRSVSSAEYDLAHEHAIDSIESRFAAAASCARVGARSTCTLTGLPFTFAVISPLPSAASCVQCDPARSVQVNFAQPTFDLTFARVLGQSTWNVAVTSVAGLEFGKAFTIVTLRPPSSTAISGVRDLAINGGTVVNVDNGDVGTNANMTYSGSGSILTLDSGYEMYFYDPANPALWGASPPGTRLTALIPDPGYPVPSRGGAPTGAEDTTNCAAIAATIFANPNYAPSVPLDLGAPDMTKIHCYTKGIYPAGLDVPNGELAILEPGLYFFDNELTGQGSLIGGYTPASEGVALVFRQGEGTEFKLRTGGTVSLEGLVALNAGSKLGNSSGLEATAARDYAGGFVQTNTTPPKLMTLIVPPDPSCPVTLPFPSSCSNLVENQNKAIDLAASNLYIAGVQYGPSDNMTFTGDTGADGYIGQVWSWTLVYTGGSIINQEGDQTSGPGTLRLNAACTAPGTACVP